jgi:hypothetical protein
MVIQSKHLVLLFSLILLRGVFSPVFAQNSPIFYWSKTSVNAGDTAVIELRSANVRAINSGSFIFRTQGLVDTTNLVFIGYEYNPNVAILKSPPLTYSDAAQQFNFQLFFTNDRFNNAFDLPDNQYIIRLKFKTNGGAQRVLFGVFDNQYCKIYRGSDALSLVAVAGEIAIGRSNSPLQLTGSVRPNDSCATSQRVDYTVSGGVGTVRPNWRINSGRPNITNMDDGDFFLTLTDSLQNTASALFYAGVPASKVNFTARLEQVCGTNTGNLVIRPIGGIRPYRFTVDSLMTNSTDSIVRNVFASNYNVRVTDARGCSYSRRDYYQIQTPINVSVQELGLDSCGYRTVGAVATGGTPPYSYRWFSYRDTLPPSTNEVFKFYNLYYQWYNVIVTDANGCTNTGGYRAPNLTFGPLDFTKSYTANNCGDSLGTLMLRGSQSRVSDSLQFSVNGSAFTRDTVFRNIRSGNAIIRIKNRFGCERTAREWLFDSLSVIQYYINYKSACGIPAPLSIFAYRYNGDSSFTYSLNNQPFTSNRTFQNITPGRYFLRIRNASGCFLADSITLRASGLEFRIQPTSSNACFSPDSLWMRVVPTSGQAPYRFSVLGTNIQNTMVDSFKFRTNTFPQIQVTDANGCQGTNSFYIAPQVDSFFNIFVRFVPNSNLPCNQPQVGTLTVVARQANGERPAFYQLDGGTRQTDTIFTNVRAGWRLITVTSAAGCTQRRSFVVGDSLSLGIQLSLLDSCVNRQGIGSLFARVSGGVAPYRYAWSNGSTSFALFARAGNYSVTVTDASGCSATMAGSIQSCVWPGDTDTSGVVDNRDLLNIGLHFGERGAVSCFDSVTNNFCTQWREYRRPNWSKQTANVVNFKHLDCNGDGTINAVDTNAIMRNWNRTRRVVGNDNTIEPRSAGVPVWIQTHTVNGGNWVAMPVMLGDSGTTNSAYGIAVSVKYTPSVIEPNSMYFRPTNSWWGAPSDLIHVFKDEVDNVFHVALSKTNHNNASGRGQIGTLHFKIRSDANSNDLQFGVYNGLMLNRDGEPLDLTQRSTTAKVLTTSTQDFSWANQLSVYPNPTTNFITVEAQNIDIQRIEVYDMVGKLLQSQTVNAKSQIGVPLSNGTAGTYFLKVYTDKGVVVRKVVRL